MKLDFKTIENKILEHRAKSEYKQASIVILRNIFEEAEKEQCNIADVINSALLEELSLKLIGMECFADEYYSEDAKAGCKTIFDELKKWINQKRKLIIK